MVPAAAVLGSLFSVAAFGAPKPDLWPLWEASDATSSIRVDHEPWDRFLDRYLDTSHTSGVNLVRYGSVTPEDRKSLEDYVSALQGIKVSDLARREQEAYWINLYNALTVKVILDHYPVRSIREINISPGFFAVGPWGAKLLKIEGEDLSLNDIEHRILRPIWKDNRVHYAVNCASIGCPNLQPVAYTAKNTDHLLEEGARAYVNHSRGARIEGKKLTVSSIYDWFRVDFGGSTDGVIEHLLLYAEEPLASELKSFEGKVRNEYDWSLNEE